MHSCLLWIFDLRTFVSKAVCEYVEGDTGSFLRVLQHPFSFAALGATLCTLLQVFAAVSSFFLPPLSVALFDTD